MADNRQTQESCSHDCSSCGSSCPSKDGGAHGGHEKLNEHSSVKKVVAVVSGKGGVGKSMVTALSAVTANRNGYKVGVMDADITGPSIPKMFGIHHKAYGSEIGIIPGKSASEIKVMSLNLLTENESDPVVWRGPVIAGAVTQFWTDVAWGDLDVMFIDMPPGTGDVPLTVFQSLPIDGIIVVTSPQELVSMIVEKAVKMARMMNIPIIGIVENMSYFKCPCCNEELSIFGESDLPYISRKFGLTNVAKIPLNKNIPEMVDEGEAEKLDTDYLSDILDSIEKL